MTIDYGGETTVQPPSANSTPPEHDVVIADIVVFRGRTNGYEEHARDIARDDLAEFSYRLWDLVAEAGMSHVHGIGTWEPFLMWVGPDVEANLRRALRFAQALVCDPTLGVNRSLRTRLWAQAGIAYGRGRALRPGSSPLGDEVADLFGKGVSDVGRRASRLGHAAPAGAIIIDDWALRRLEPSTLSGVEVLPVTVADGKGGWLLPAETVHGLVIDQAA